jgi:carbonic anhydrase
LKKFIGDIIQFRLTRREAFRRDFATLAGGQNPDALVFTCSDSRVAATTFANVDPGDLFVVRNLGNLVPAPEKSVGSSAAAAIEFALGQLKVRHIVVCGHSGCGAMQAHCAGHETLPPGPLKDWLDAAATGPGKGTELNEASRQNVLQQLAHIRLYPQAASALSTGALQLHALWFDIAHFDVYYHEAEPGGWTLIDEIEGKRILERL